MLAALKMNGLNRRAIFEGFLLALALTSVGWFLGFPPVGLFAGTAAGSYIAARRAGHHEAAQGAAVAALVVVAAFLGLLIAYQITTNVSINGTTLMLAATVLLLGTAIGLATRRSSPHRTT